MTEDILKIAVCEPSGILRGGISSALRRISGFRFQIIELPDYESLNQHLQLYLPDILIIQPVYLNSTQIAEIRKSSQANNLKLVAFQIFPFDNSILSNFDQFIGINDTTEMIQEKFEKLSEVENDEETLNDSDVLSQREKEILTCVVKGLTNKETAKQLHLSAHTVIAHRRNIARKLEVHSTAGLTIYAIVNKLVTLEEVKSVIE